jgi:hypothetical protein
MGCNTCKNKEQEVSLNNLPNYSMAELEKAYLMMDRPHYTGEESAWLYNLYNRVFRTNKQPGCGKCFVNVRRSLKARYEAER